MYSLILQLGLDTFIDSITVATALSSAVPSNTRYVGQPLI